jgi:hypothetical protein
MGYTRRRQTKLVYPMLPVSLDCFCFVCLRLVYTMLPVSLDCLRPGSCLWYKIFD